MKEVAGSDEPTVNYHLNLQLLLALWAFTVSFSSLFDVWSIHLLFGFPLTALIVLVLATKQFPVEKKHNSLKQQTDTVRDADRREACSS